MTDTTRTQSGHRLSRLSKPLRPRHVVKLARIEKRRATKLARHETAQKYVEIRGKRVELRGIRVQSKAETAQNKATSAVEKVHAKADLQRAKAEKKAVQAKSGGVLNVLKESRKALAMVALLLLLLLAVRIFR